MHSHSRSFFNAQDFFEYYFDEIMRAGVNRRDTKAIFNAGGLIQNPTRREIKTPWRKWKSSYAEKEWNWYMKGDRNAEEIAKEASIWYDMMDDDGNVWSNYGWQWERNDQFTKVLEHLESNKDSRRAVLTFYDGKEFGQYENDYPCTLSVNFYIESGILHMTVNMRSCDLVYGFCNDQYCFSKLQELVAGLLNMPIGNYYHFATDLHIYERHWDMKSKWLQSLNI